MKKIEKLGEPKKLTEYRTKADAVYDGPNFTIVKDDIKKSLLKEQGHLCAYCMARITISKMKVEHFLSQTDNDKEQLNYKNLLGCCIGGEGSKQKNQTCDTKKGSKSLSYSPASQAYNIETKINYSMNSGKISSSEIDFNKEIDEVLNLNFSRLVTNRKKALEGVENFLSAKAGQRTKAEIQKAIETFSSKNSNDKFKEYHGFILCYLSKKLAKF